MNLQKMMKQAQAMQAKMAEMQEKAEATETEGESGSGMVKVTLNGKGYAKTISIDASLIDAEEKDMLEDLVVAAINDAKKKSEDAMADEMSSLTAGMQLPPGIKLPF